MEENLHVRRSWTAFAPLNCKGFLLGPSIASADGEVCMNESCRSAPVGQALAADSFLQSRFKKKLNPNKEGNPEINGINICFSKTQ
jgi:hypothetical protein